MAKKPVNWQQGFMNPDMPPAVIKALAERGYAPDGARLPAPTIGAAFDGMTTQQRLAALNDRISQDWQGMGFMPPQTMADPRAQYVGNNTDIFVGANSQMANTGPDPFGQETRQKLAALNQRIDGDMMRLAEAPLEAPAMPQRSPVGGMSYTPPLPAPPPPPPVPKPTPRPRPGSYVIKQGDNPTTIARRFGLTLSELEAKNPGILKRARKLRPGQAVNI